MKLLMTLLKIGVKMIQVVKYMDIHIVWEGPSGGAATNYEY
jgi:hypothetical protein